MFRQKIYLTFEHIHNRIDPVEYSLVIDALLRTIVVDEDVAYCTDTGIYYSQTAVSPEPSPLLSSMVAREKYTAIVECLVRCYLMEHFAQVVRPQ